MIPSSCSEQRSSIPSVYSLHSFIMRTALLPFALLPLLTFSQIPNAGFENWVDQGGYLEPENWLTYNDAAPGATVLFVEPGSPGAVGNHHAVITSRMVPGGSTIQGWMSAGTSNNNAGFPYTARPAMLTGQWQYGVEPTDTAQVEVYLMNFGTQTWVAYGVLQVTGSLDSWQEFQVPLTYFSPDFPDTAGVVISASIDFTAPVAGSFVKVDNLAFVGTVGIDEVHASKALTVFPNPGADQVTLDLPPGPHTIILFDATGRPVLQQRSTDARPVIATEALPAGLYRIAVRDEQGGMMGATWVKE